MESSMASWSSPSTNGLVHNESITTDYFPTSPLRSPTLYDHSGENGDKSLAASRAKLAEDLLRDIENGRDSQYPQSDLLDEAFVNLELFGDLEPAYDPYEDTQPELSYIKDQLYETPVPSPPIPDEYPNETYNQLEAEFQQILDQLPDSSFEMNEETVELIENIMDMTEDDQQEVGTNNNSNSSSDEEASINQQQNEEEVFGMEYYLTEDSSSLNTDNEHEPAVENEDVSEKILDALLQGDLVAANSFLPKVPVTTSSSQIQVTYQPYQNVAILPAESEEPGPSTSNQATKSSKTKSRGGSKKRAPKTSQKKPRLSPRVDRAQRKKEQNKTAATRYREKKKLLASLVNQQEDVLSDRNKKLIDEKNDLSKQISIIKQLLREVMNAKKKKSNSVKKFQ